MQPVKASGFTDVHALLKRLELAANRAGFRIHEYGVAGAHPLLAFTRRTPGVRPRIYLSAGCHGDEPAGPAALLKLLEHGYFASQANWFICPLLNPLGMERGTRENPDGIDLNRDYRKPRTYEVSAHVSWLCHQPRFDVALCLHEDWESAGFYLYELNPSGRPSLAPRIVQAVSAACPIELAELIDGRPGKDGIIRPVDEPALRETWPEAIYLREHHTDLCFTTESPSLRRIEQRVAAQCISVETVVTALSDR